jgi:hypothetical protein
VSARARGVRTNPDARARPLAGVSSFFAKNLDSQNRE